MAKGDDEQDNETEKVCDWKLILEIIAEKYVNHLINLFNFK